MLNLACFVFTQFLGGKLNLFIGHDMTLDIVSKRVKIRRLVMNNLQKEMQRKTSSYFMHRYTNMEAL